MDHQKKIKTDQLPHSKQFLLRKYAVPLSFMALGVLIAGLFLRDLIYDWQLEQQGYQTFTGTFYETPVPMLGIPAQDNPHALDHAILINTGELNTVDFFKQVKAKYGDLNGKIMTLRGRLIEGDGKLLIELAEEEKCIKRIYDKEGDRYGQVASYGLVELEGEMIAPRCYLGSGANDSCKMASTPPIMIVQESWGIAYYVLVVNENAKISQKTLINLLGPIWVKGEREYFAGWNFLYIDPVNLAKK